jgi:Zn-dependent peptidase ImmA (M78 family)
VTGHYQNLREVREKLLGYRHDETVARLARISIDRLRAIESGAAPSVYEIEELSRVYGIDADILADEPIVLSKGDGISVLTLREEFRDLSDVVRARIVAAANAARDLGTLRKLLGQPDARNAFRSERPALKAPRKDTVAHMHGTKLAAELRTKFDLGVKPIPSMRDLVLTHFRSIALLYADLTDDGPAGISFVDALRGPAIVLNLAGKNENAPIRRFSLAHELCHMLVDWSAEPLAVISGYLSDRGLEAEQRANSFAVRFICPQSRFDRIAPHLPTQPALEELGRFGLSYPAARLATRYTTGKELPPAPPLSWSTLNDARWADPEAPIGIERFPLPIVPPERRTLVAAGAAQAYSRKLISRDRFADLLGVTPGAELEKILDFFGLDLPTRDIA